MPSYLRQLMLLIPLLAGFGVHAASIGAIDVSSHLGEPLQARVPIDLDGVSISGDDCVHIVGPARRHPVLSTAVVTLVSRGGHNFVSIVTDKPINDPLFDLSLRTYCGPSLQKDFVILLSPDSLTPAAAAVPAMVDITVPTVVADAVAPARPVRRATTPRASTPRRAAVAAPAARRHKAASISVLRLDYGHEAFGRQADGIAQTRLAEHPAEAANKPSTSDRLVLQAPTEQPAGAGAMPPDQAGQSYRPQTEPAGTPTGPVAGNGGAIQAPAPAPVGPPWYARLSGIYLLLPLILLAGAGALWLIRRRPRSRFQNETLPDLNTLFPSEPETQPRHATLTLDLPDHEPPPVEPAPVEPARTRPMPTEAAPPPPSRLTTEAMEHMMGLGAPAGPAEEIQVEHQDSFDHVMELAEVMLAFGRSGQAIEALSRHIHANPRQSVDPWLKLLDLYHQSDLHAEFDALASDLHRNYNIAMPDWDDFAASQAVNHESGPPDLESLPHIMSRLTESWGSQAALDYLNKLLEDNRGGQRLGFSMAMVRDILLLRDILRQICPGSAIPH